MKKLCFALLIVFVIARSVSATTMSNAKYKCSVCGAENEYSVLTSTNAFGAPDLDLRPPEMQRSTMSLWVQECPECKYTASEVSDPCGVSRDFLKSEAYLKCEGLTFKSDLAARFYREYMILKECGNIRGAFYAALHSAWACDDKRDSVNAKLCREKAASFASELLADENLKGSGRASILLMRADILRRAGKFEEVISEYSSVKFEDDGRNDPEIMNAVVKFELERSRAHDTKCYTVEDATKGQ